MNVVPKTNISYKINFGRNDVIALTGSFSLFSGILILIFFSTTESSSSLRSLPEYERIFNPKQPIVNLRYLILHLFVILLTLVQIFEICGDFIGCIHLNPFIWCNLVTILRNIIFHKMLRRCLIRSNALKTKYFIFLLFLLSFGLEIFKIFIDLIDFYNYAKLDFAKFKLYTIFIKIILNIMTMALATRDSTYTMKNLSQKNKNFKKESIYHLKMQIFFDFFYPSTLKFRFYMFICFFCVLSGRIINYLLPKLFNKLVENFNRGHKCKRKELIYEFCIFIFLTFLQGHPGIMTGILSLTQEYFWNPLQQNMNRIASLRLYSNILRSNVQFLPKFRHREFVKFSLNGGKCIEQIISATTFHIIPPFIDLIISISYLVNNTHFVFALIVGFTFFGTTSVSMFMSKYRQNLKDEITKYQQKTKKMLENTVYNLETINIYSNQTKLMKSFERVIEIISKQEKEAKSKLLGIDVFQNGVVLIGLVFGCVICLSDQKTKNNYKNDLIIFLNYMNQIYMPLTWVGKYFQITKNSMSELEKIFEFITDTVQYQNEYDQINIKIKGKIEFVDVSFKYPQCLHYCLKNVSFKVEPGNSLDIIGESNSGKSTILYLILKYYEEYSGLIIIDEINIREIPQKEIMKNISYLPQKMNIFHDSIKNNIQCGNTVNFTDFEQAIHAATADKLIARLNEGYDKMIDPIERSLNKTEMNKICIARTLLKKSCLYMIDEAETAIDKSNGNKIIENILKKPDSTKIMISHRINCARACNNVLLLEDGKVLVYGNHDELIKSNSSYRKFWNKKF